MAASSIDSDRGRRNKDGASGSPAYVGVDWKQQGGGFVRAKIFLRLIPGGGVVVKLI